MLARLRQENVPVFEKPLKESPIIMTLSKDSLFQILSPALNEKEWLLIRIQSGQRGFIQRRGLKFVSYSLFQVLSETILYDMPTLDATVILRINANSKIHLTYGTKDFTEAVDSDWARGYISGKVLGNVLPQTNPLLLENEYMKQIIGGVIAIILTPIFLIFLALLPYNPFIYFIVLSLLCLGGCEEIIRGIKTKKVVKNLRNNLNLDQTVLNEDNLNVPSSAQYSNTAVSASPQPPIVPPVDTVTEHLDKMKDWLDKTIKCPKCGYTSSSYYIIENKRICKNCGVELKEETEKKIQPIKVKW